VAAVTPAGRTGADVHYYGALTSRVTQATPRDATRVDSGTPHVTHRHSRDGQQRRAVTNIAVAATIGCRRRSASMRDLQHVSPVDDQAESIFRK